MQHKKLLLIIVIALLILFIIFAPGLLLSWGIERSLETVTGAKVEVHGCHVELLKLKVTIGGFEAANPKHTWRNLIQTDGIYFQIEGKPLLSGRIVIDNVGIDGFRVDTPRKTDGKLNRPISPLSLAAALDKLESQIPPAPVFDLEALSRQVLDVRSLADSFNLTLNSTADAITGEINRKKEELAAGLSGTGSVTQKIDDLKRDFDELKKPSVDIPGKIKSLENLQKTVSSINGLINGKRGDFNRALDDFNSKIDNLSEQAKADLKMLLAKVNLPDLNVNMSEALFGRLLLEQSAPFIELADRLRNLKLYPPNPDINLAKPHFPKFLIKHVGISGENIAGATDGFNAGGAAEFITNEPATYGKPLTVFVSGNTRQDSKFTFNIWSNRFTSNYIDSVAVKLDNLKIPRELPWKDSPYLPLQADLDQVNLQSSLDVTPGGFILFFNIEAGRVRCDYSRSGAPADEAMRIIRETLNSLGKCNLSLELTEKNGEMRMSVSSNAGSGIFKALKEKLGADINRFTEILNTEITRRLGEKQRELRKVKDDSKESLSGTLDDLKGRLNTIDGSISDLIKDLKSKLPPEPDVDIPHVDIPAPRGF